MCNHCPYVRHIETALGALLSSYPDLAIVGICTNGADAYPADQPNELAGQARRADWNFPDLVDADQKVGHAYHAACRDSGDERRQESVWEETADPVRSGR